MQQHDHDQAEREPGTFTLAELHQLAGAGAIEIIQPGTPEAAAFDREMAAQIDQVDEELRRSEGPDAVTSDRLLRSAAIGAEQDPQLVGYALAAFCRSRGWERSDLANWLGVTVDQLAALALERRAAPGAIGRLGDRFGADAGRLTAVLT